MSTKTAALLGGLGRTLIVLGLLVLAFAGFQLWGTGLAEARAQNSLDNEFDALLVEAKADLPATTAPVENEPGPDADPLVVEPVVAEPDEDPSPLPQLSTDQLPVDGGAMGRIHIPAIDVTKTFVEGVSRDVLRLGPGHYPDTPLPGQPGNAAIAGHRTTHGAPFFDIDQLVPGDEIIVDTLQGQFTYLVEGHDAGNGNQLGHFIVAPTDVGVIADQGDNRITLTACNPKYSAKQRIIVTAILDSQVAPASPPPVGQAEPATEQGSAAEDNSRLGADDQQVPTPPIDDGTGDAVDAEIDGRELANTIGASDGITESLGWQPEHAKPTAIWTAVTLLLTLIGWAAGRAWRRWPAYILAAPSILACLFLSFTHLDKLIPAV